MKRFAVALLALVALATAYFIGTMNGSRVISVPPAEWTAGSEAAEAWREHVVSLEAAGLSISAVTSETIERREGLEFLTQLASASLEMKIAKGDTTHPKFTNWMADYRKFLGDTPDAIYHTAQLSGEHAYEISGNRGDAEYLGFMLYGTGLNGWNRAAKNISSETISFDADGSFRLVLSKKKPAGSGDWIEIEDDIHMVMVRQYFHGRRSKTEAQFSIRNLAAHPATPRSDARLAASIRAATTFFNETLHGAIALAGMLAKAPNSPTPPKEYSNDFGGIFYPTNDNQYFGTWFALEDDEALVVEGDVPDGPYWSVSLQNRWMQSLDYENHQVALHDEQLVVRDGRYRIVVASRDPGAENWLDTAGHREGLFSIRYQLASALGRPSIRVVPLAGATPASSPRP